MKKTTWTPLPYKFIGRGQKVEPQIFEQAPQPVREGLKFLGVTGNGIPVYDRFKSHFQDHGFSAEVLQEALSHIYQTASFEKHVVNMGRVVGCTTCVKVEAEDRVVMAVRKRRQGPTPMVMGRQPELCSSVVIILKKVRDEMGEYFILITAFVGEGSEPEPWDRQLAPGSPEHARAVRFWQTHALIYDEEVIDYIIS